jgi:serine protease
MDSDVNDVFTGPVFNDSFFTAQRCIRDDQRLWACPARGRGTRASGDEFDTYRVSLKAGQAVVLVLGAIRHRSTWICLYGPSIPSGIVEGIGAVGRRRTRRFRRVLHRRVPVRGLRLQLTYVLSVAQTAPAARSAQRTDVPFVPGDRAHEAESDRRPPLARGGSATAADTLALDRSRAIRARMLVRLRPRRARARRSARSAARTRTARCGRRRASRPNTLRRETVLALKELRRRPKSSRRAQHHPAPALVPRPLYTLQWHYPMIGLPQAWDATTGSPDVVVAVIDTGVVLSHPDLAGKLVAGYDFISSPAIARWGRHRRQPRIPATSPSASARASTARTSRARSARPRTTAAGSPEWPGA